MFGPPDYHSHARTHQAANALTRKVSPLITEIMRATRETAADAAKKSKKGKDKVRFLSCNHPSGHAVGSFEMPEPRIHVRTSLDVWNELPMGVWERGRIRTCTFFCNLWDPFMLNWLPSLFRHPLTPQLAYRHAGEECRQVGA